jgi:hypothetical protein
MLAGAAPFLGPIAGGLGGGYLGHALGGKVSDILGTHEKTTRDVMGVAGGAAAGAAIGSIVPGIGTAIGAVVGGVVGFAQDLSVICSELHRQGEISERERQVCVAFRFRHIPNDMFMAYLEWAEPIVKVMRKGGICNRILLPFAHAFIGYMLAVQAKRVPSFAERMVWKYAWWRCEKIAQLTERFAKEVSDGHAI